MLVRRSCRALGALVLACAATALAARRDLAEFDAAGAGAKRAMAPVEAPLRRLAAPVHVDDRFGLPTFVLATGAGAEAKSGPPARAAREHLARLAPIYRLSPADVEGAHLHAVHDTGRGGIVVTFRQRVDGIEVFRDEVDVLMGRDLGLRAVSGYLPARVLAKGSSGDPFAVDVRSLIGSALEDIGGFAIDGASLRRTRVDEGGYEVYESGRRATTAGAAAYPSPIRAKRVWFHLPGVLEPAYYIELADAGGADPDAYSYVLSATDGRLLFRHRLVADEAYSYRVWAAATGLAAPQDGPRGDDPSPHPTGVPDGYEPPYVAPRLVTLQNGPISTNDPWLPPGSTETVGNNADAYVDLGGADGLTAGDFRATVTEPGSFDRAYDPQLPPNASSAQRQASITQLFYTVNYLHDWYYDAGFDEASGNAQASNYGRGGIQGDRLRAEAQDSGGFNNANMLTPADGGQPRMQMFVFIGTPEEQRATVHAPAAIAGNYAVGVAAFGPVVFDITADLVQVADGAAPSSDACSVLTAGSAAQVAGKIALVDRGTCSFVSKAANVQAAGAAGMLLINNVPGAAPAMTGAGTITIPAVSLGQDDGNAVRARLPGVNVRLLRGTGVNRDGSLDNLIVAHEWGHYISSRLIGNANGLSNVQGGGMGEGWGDFHALLASVRQEDASAAANPDYSGAYSVAAYAEGDYDGLGSFNDAYYFGIRRYPYSTDFGKNALTFRHIAAGEPLPDTVPSAPNAASNAQVHNTGEVWATMLWECYAALLRDTGRLTFDEAQVRMRDYLVAAYKMTPNAPTFLEARDALLAVARAADFDDFTLFWQAFAKRGAGVGAVAPVRTSTDNTGVVESYSVGGELALAAVELAAPGAPCDGDDYLDEGETGTLAIELTNIGSSSLAATTATIISSNPAVVFPAGNQIALPASAPAGTVAGLLPIALSGSAGIELLEFQIEFDDPGLALAGPRRAAFTAYANVDEIPSATENVERVKPPWTVARDAALASTATWRRIEIAADDHRWHAPGEGSRGDQYLISPELEVSTTASFGIGFKHRHVFESSAGNYYDGGVVEISVGGGPWIDIGAGRYGGSIFAGAMNPLEGRMAFVGKSAGWPALTSVTINLGMAHSGQTLRLRFRMGTDAAVGEYGWDIDDIVISGITNEPFFGQGTDAAVCAEANADADGDGFPNAADCAPGDAAAFAAPGEITGLMLWRVDPGCPDMLSWNPGGGGPGIRYDVLRGNLGGLPVGPGGGDEVGLCGHEESWICHFDDPAPDEGFWFLLRGTNVCGDGSYGEAAVARASATCP